jgi:hypothetical protein
VIAKDQVKVMKISAGGAKNENSSHGRQKRH